MYYGSVQTCKSEFSAGFHLRQLICDGYFQKRATIPYIAPYPLRLLLRCSSVARPLTAPSFFSFLGLGLWKPLHRPSNLLFISTVSLDFPAVRQWGFVSDCFFMHLELSNPTGISYLALPVCQSASPWNLGPNLTKHIQLNNPESWLEGQLTELY